MSSSDNTGKRENIEEIPKEENIGEVQPLDMDVDQDRVA
jgi:hypothetical protein